MFLKPSIAESDGLTSLDKKSATTPNSGRRPSLESKSGAAKSDDEESQRQKLIDSVLMRNRSVFFICQKFPWREGILDCLLPKLVPKIYNNVFLFVVTTLGTFIKLKCPNVSTIDYLKKG